MRCCNPKVLEFFGGASITPGSSGSGSGGGGGGGGADEIRSYSFDLCAHEGFSQEQMFSSCGLMPLLSAAVDGYAGICYEYCFRRFRSLIATHHSRYWPV